MGVPWRRVAGYRVLAKRKTGAMFLPMNQFAAWVSK
jgi:hypothetical protein